MLNGEEIDNWEVYDADGYPVSEFGMFVADAAVTTTTSVGPRGFRSTLSMLLESAAGDKVHVVFKSAAHAAMVADALADMASQMEDEATDSYNSPVPKETGNHRHNTEDTSFTEDVPDELREGCWYSNGGGRSLVLLGML